MPGTWDNKKRALCPLQKYEDEEDEDEDEEDDEEEEINDETNLSLKFKVKGIKWIINRLNTYLIDDRIMQNMS